MRPNPAPRRLWLLFAAVCVTLHYCTANENDTVLTPPTSSNGTAQDTTALPQTVPSSSATASTNAHTNTNATTMAPGSNATSVTSPSSNSTATSIVTATTQAPSISSTSLTATTKPAATNSTFPKTSATVPNTTGTAGQSKSSKFDAGSFVGGIVLTLGILIVLYLGCKFYASKRGVQYRTIDEHEAII
ncbi:porimin isoform X1 [Ambystoma mexicanum]|uniref:porimin isoform X1 n=1 Tax=Ambystoma mexicanum TaxID=8296 RepID=UPI0037E7857B